MFLQKKCFRCKRTFNCEENVNTCWCKDLKITPEVLNSIKIECNDCLCESCLSQLSN
ncbi:MAG: hypothetical protein D4R72_01770 [Nitrosopumilales archaeon]|nr:MAG: hypothetical protein D4R72_01770 [Nitrosopumilales archaeon]